MGTLALVNGKIVTVDERFSIAAAVLIDGDRITATGAGADILANAGPGAEVVDLGGRTVIPGLIDNHNHFVRATEHPEVRLGVRREGRQVVATVEDDGPGLPPENLETVFERFYTARPKGALLSRRAFVANVVPDPSEQRLIETIEKSERLPAAKRRQFGGEG